MAHIKRNTMPKNWPVPRKSVKKRFAAKPSHSISKAISILFVLRDLLGIAKSRKEAKYMCYNGFVKVNNKIRKDENFPLQVFDVLSLEESKKNYRIEIVNKKFSLKEISEKEKDKKVVKITGKKIIKGNLIQMNLDDGGNFITKEKFKVGDSALINTKENKIEKILELKEGSSVEIVLGKHAGEKGKIKGLEKLKKGTDYIVKLKDFEATLPLKTILVIE